MTVSTVTTPCGFITSFFLLFSFTTVLVRDSVVVWTYSAPNPLFLCGSCQKRFGGCRRLASGLVRRSMDTDRFWLPSDRRARKCGASVWVVSGVPIVYASVTFRHAINCFGVRAGAHGSVHRQTANSTCVRAVLGRRQRCDWLAV